LPDLVKKDGGIAILEKGTSFGGGCLQYFGINSNTSATGFMKCTYKKRKVSSFYYDYHFRPQESTTEESILSSASKKTTKVEEDSDAIDSEREDPGTEQKVKGKQYIYEAYEPYKEFVKSPLFQHMSEYRGSIIPLSIVGMFMNYVGNYLLHYIHQ
jgi:hypothetical protein